MSKPRLYKYRASPTPVGCFGRMGPPSAVLELGPSGGIVRNLIRPTGLKGEEGLALWPGTGAALAAFLCYNNFILRHGLANDS
jgi:hypothetical protein